MQDGKKLASSEELKGKRSSESGGKKKNSFLLRGLLLVLAVGLAAGIYYFSGKVQPEAKEQPTATMAQDERVRLIDRAREEVSEVSVERNGAIYTVVPGKNGEEKGTTLHKLKERPDFDLDQAKADAVLACAAHLTATRRVTEKAEDLSAYGLEPPLARVTMRYTDGTETVWRIGDQAPTSTASYLMREGDEAVYLLYASAVESLSAARNSLHTMTMPGTVEPTRIRNLIIEQTGKDTVELGYSEEGAADKGYSVSALRLKQPFYYTASADRAQEMFEGVSALKIISFAGAPDELRDTGLEEGNSRFRLTVTQAAADNPAETETYVFRIGNRTDDGTSVYMTVDESPAVYLTDASAVRFLEDATPAYLADSFTNLIYIRAVRAIELQSGENHWLMEIEHGQDEKTADVFFFNGEKVLDESAFRKLYQRIIGLTSSKLSEDYYLEGETLLSVRYELETEPGELLVEYLDYDADYCAVRRDGLTLFLLKKEQLNTLLEALKEF